MPRYCVIVSRLTAEYTVVNVETYDDEAAEDLAVEMVKNDPAAFEWNWSSSTISSDPNNVDEIGENEGAKQTPSAA